MRLRKADCRGTGVPPASRRAVSALLPTARTTGETPVGLMGGTPMPRCRATASMECGGDDTALARASASKAASRRPQSAWRLTIILTAALLPASALAQSRPAETTRQDSPQSQPATSTAPTTNPALLPAPITFGRSGKMVKADLTLTGWSTHEEDRPDGQPVDHWVQQVVLHAYGRIWSDKIPVNNKSWRGPMSGIEAEIKVPTVRVPTVFSIRSVMPMPVGPGGEIGILVAYPDKDAHWDRSITLYSYGTPLWFNQWASATGLPVKQIAHADLASAKLAPADEKDKALLILGYDADADRKDLPDMAKLAKDKKVNVFVLHAFLSWDLAGPVNVAPAQMLGGLANIASQHWPQPLKFSSRRKCWPGIANRWAWIADGNGLPLVEELAQHPFLRPRIVLSYLQWQDQLGRREQADELLVGLLTAAATLEMHKGLGAFTRFGPIEVWMVYPPDKQIEPKGRPVLSSMRSGRYSIVEPKSVSILDLRGTEKLPAELLGECRKIEGSIGPREGRKESDLLILGDDRMLDEWEWLKLDRAKKTINRPGVVWLSNDELPPSKDNQIRLMLKLTELGVPVAPPSQQEEKKQ